MISQNEENKFTEKVSPSIKFRAIFIARYAIAYNLIKDGHLTASDIEKVKSLNIDEKVKSITVKILNSEQK